MSARDILDGLAEHFDQIQAKADAARTAEQQTQQPTTEDKDFLESFAELLNQNNNEEGTN